MNVCRILLLMLIPEFVSAQNMVPNGGFEQYSGCPNSYAQFDSVLFWMNPHVFPSAGGSPDYFNNCTFSTYVDVPDNYWGYRPARSGNGYAGFIPWYVNPPGFREYIEVPLTSTLQAGSCYYFEMYLSICDVCRFTTDDIGVYFSDTLVAGINNNQHLPYIPQLINNQGFFTDTMNWTLFSGYYIASGGENYLIIGNFNDDAHTDTMFFNAGGFHEPYFYVDDVSLVLCTGTNDNEPDQSFIISEDPAGASLNIAYSADFNEKTSLYVFDIYGRKITEWKLSGGQNHILWRHEGIAAGIYFISILRNSHFAEGKKVKIMR